MVTPQELEKANFKTSFRGYDPAEVDAYVDYTIEKYGELYRINTELEKKLSELYAKIARLENSKSADFSTEKLNDAKKQASYVIEKTKIDCEAIIDSAKKAYGEAVAKIEELNETVRKFKGNIFALYQDQITALAGFDSVVSVPEFNVDFDTDNIVTDFADVDTEVKTINQERDKAPAPAENCKESLNLDTLNELSELLSADEDSKINSENESVDSLIGDLESMLSDDNASAGTKEDNIREEQDREVLEITDFDRLYFTTDDK